MGKLHIRVTLEWRKHFDAPVALVRTAGDCGDALVADEDASLYMLDKNAHFKWYVEFCNSVNHLYHHHVSILSLHSNR